MEFTKLLLFITVCCTGLTLIIGYKHWRSYLWWYMLFSLWADIMVIYILKPNGFNYKWPGHIYGVAQFILLSMYVRQYINEKYRNAFYIYTLAAAALIIAWIIHGSIWLNNRESYILYFIYLLYGLLGFYILLQSNNYQRIDSQAYFWINVMLVLYSATVFTINLFAPYLLKTNRDLLAILWPTVICIANIMQRIILVIAFTRKDYR